MGDRRGRHIMLNYADVSANLTFWISPLRGAFVVDMIKTISGRWICTAEIYHM